MNTLLAAIQGTDIITSVLGMIVLGVIAWLLFWLIDYCALPEPINKVVRVILVIAIVVVLINFLLGLVGQPFIQWN
jgi:uncharacterized membrane protein